jgi:hypothetical protein
MNWRIKDGPVAAILLEQKGLWVAVSARVFI